MTGEQIVRWVERHGGLKAVEVREIGDGWANTLVCHDGSRLVTSADQDRDINRVLRERDAGVVA